MKFQQQLNRVLESGVAQQHEFGDTKIMVAPNPETKLDIESVILGYHKPVTISCIEGLLEQPLMFGVIYKYIAAANPRNPSDATLSGKLNS